jgi:hypothetical protein
VKTRTARQWAQTTPQATKSVRCAIYTRKSTEDGVRRSRKGLAVRRAGQRGSDGRGEQAIAEGHECLNKPPDPERTLTSAQSSARLAPGWAGRSDGFPRAFVVRIVCSS